MKGISGDSGIGEVLGGLNQIEDKMEDIIDLQDKVGKVKVQVDDSALDDIVKDYKGIKNRIEKEPLFKDKFLNNSKIKKDIDNAENLLKGMVKKWQDGSKFSELDIQKILVSQNSLERYGKLIGKDLRKPFEDFFDWISNSNSDVLPFTKNEINLVQKLTHDIELYKKVKEGTLKSVKIGGESYELKPYTGLIKATREEMSEWKGVVLQANEDVNRILRESDNKQIEDNLKKRLAEKINEFIDLKNEIYENLGDDKALDLDDIDYGNLIKDIGDVINRLKEAGKETKELEEIIDLVSRGKNLSKEALSATGRGTGTGDGTGNLEKIESILSNIEKYLNEIQVSLGKVDDESGLSNIIKSIEILLNKLDEVREKIGNGVFQFNVEGGDNSVGRDVDRVWRKQEQRYTSAYDRILQQGEKAGYDMQSTLLKLWSGTEDLHMGYTSEEFMNLFSPAALQGIDDAETKIKRLISLFEIIKKVRKDKFLTQSDKFFNGLNKVTLPATNLQTIERNLKKAEDNGSAGQFADELEEKLKGADNEADEVKVDLKEITSLLEEISSLLNLISDKNSFGEIFDKASTQIAEIILSIHELGQILSNIGDTLPSQLNESFEKTTKSIQEQIEVLDRLNKERKESVSSNLEIKAADISGENKTIEDLKGLLLEIIDLIDKKTQGFLDEEELVSASVKNEAEMVNVLLGQLELIQDALKKISEVTKGTHNGLTNGLKGLLEIVQDKDFGKSKDKLYEIKDALLEIHAALESLNVSDDSFLAQLNNLMKDGSAIKNMADLIKEYKKAQDTINKNNKKETSKKKEEKAFDSDKEAEKISDKVEENYVKQLNTLNELIAKQRESAKLYTTQNMSKAERFNGYQEQLDTINKLDAKLENYENELRQISVLNPFDVLADGKTAQQTIEELNNKIQDTITELKQAKKAAENLTYNANSIPDDNYYSRELNKLATFMSKNTGASEENMSKLMAYNALLTTMQKQGGYTKAEIDAVSNSINGLEAEMKRTGDTGKSMWDKIKTSFKAQLSAQIAMYASLQDMIRYFRTGFETIKDLDYALVDLRKTTTMSSSELNKFYLDANESAKKFGVTTKEIIEQASSWSRLGFSSQEEATKMAEMSSKFTLISPGMDVQKSMDGLVSSMKAFGTSVSDVETEIMDKINVVGRIMPKRMVTYGIVITI